MNEFITTHGDQIFNIVFVTLMVVVFGTAIYAWRLISKQHKAYINYVNSVRPEGRLIVKGNFVVFVPNISPVDPKA